jgi:hypothetical protein
MTGDNAWDYIYNTAALTGATTTIASVCSGLNGDQTILSATPTTITVSINTTGGCSYSSGGTATYDNSGTYLPAFEHAAEFSSQLAPYELTSLQNFYAAGGRFPSELGLSGPPEQYAIYYPDVFATNTPRLTAMQNYQASP